MKSLVADDDATSRLLLKTFLSRYGECDVTVDGRQAVEAFREARLHGKKYDLVCLDIMMPELDGQAALREIRGLEAKSGIFTKAVKIIMMTALGDLENLTAAYEAMCDAYLLKPIRSDRLLAELKAIGLVR